MSAPTPQPPVTPPHEGNLTELLTLLRQAKLIEVAAIERYLGYTAGNARARRERRRERRVEEVSP